MVKSRLYPKSESKIGTVGKKGLGIDGIVLATVNEKGEPGKRWFTWAQVEALGLMHVPVVDIEIRIVEAEL